MFRSLCFEGPWLEVPNIQLGTLNEATPTYVYATPLTAVLHKIASMLCCISKTLLPITLNIGDFF